MFKETAADRSSLNMVGAFKSCMFSGIGYASSNLGWAEHALLCTTVYPT